MAGRQHRALGSPRHAYVQETVAAGASRPIRGLRAGRLCQPAPADPAALCAARLRQRRPRCQPRDAWAARADRDRDRRAMDLRHGGARPHPAAGGSVARSYAGTAHARGGRAARHPSGRAGEGRGRAGCLLRRAGRAGRGPGARCAVAGAVRGGAGLAASDDGGGGGVVRRPSRRCVARAGPPARASGAAGRGGQEGHGDVVAGGHAVPEPAGWGCQRVGAARSRAHHERLRVRQAQRSAAGRLGPAAGGRAGLPRCGRRVARHRP